MLPDKDKIWNSYVVDIVLSSDGFGSPALKRSTYGAVLRQHSLAFSGFKLFYIQDTDLLKPSQVVALTPPPAVVIYQCSDPGKGERVNFQLPISPTPKAHGSYQLGAIRCDFHPQTLWELGVGFFGSCQRARVSVQMASVL